MNKKINTADSFTKNADIQKKLDRLNVLLANQISLPRVFLRGVVAGFGSVIGATLVMGLVLGLIAWAVVTLVDMPVIGGFIDQEFVTEQLQEF